MNIVEPLVELWQQTNAKAHIVRCARVCYGRESGNDDATFSRLLNHKHHSMFRHESVYAAVPYDKIRHIFHSVVSSYVKCPYIKWATINDVVYFSTNGNFLLDIEKENPTLYQWIQDNIISEEELIKVPYCFQHLVRYTFCVITQISTSRELNRVSPNNIAEQSTRYVYENGTICRPHWLEGYSMSQGLRGNIYAYKDENTDLEMEAKVRLYVESCERSFDNYKQLVDAGLHRQDARGVLPLDTATKCVYTYTIDEWRAIINLRYYGSTGKPHPNAKIIAGMIREKLIQLGHLFRD